VDDAVHTGRGSVTLKLSYGHGLLDDLLSDANWELGWSGEIKNATLLADGDWFKLSGTCYNLDDEYLYVERDVKSLGITTTNFTTFIARYKTSEIGDALGAQIKIFYEDPITHEITTQWLLASNASDGTPQFTTNGWTRKIGTLLPSKTISKIHLVANDWPDSVQSGTSSVWFDFLLICKGIYTFPYVNEFYQVELPPNRYAQVPIINRVGDISQWLGADLATVHARGTMDTRDAWKGVNGIVGEPIYDIDHNADHEAWQWFEDGRHKFKVTPATPISIGPTSEAQARYDLAFAEFRQSNASKETYYERFGLV